MWHICCPGGYLWALAKPVLIIVSELLEAVAKVASYERMCMTAAISLVDAVGLVPMVSPLPVLVALTIHCLDLNRTMAEM